MSAWDDLKAGYEAGGQLLEAGSDVFNGSGNGNGQPETFWDKLTWDGSVPPTVYPDQPTPPPAGGPPDGTWDGFAWRLDAHPGWVWSADNGAWWDGSMLWRPWSYPGSAVKTSSPTSQAHKQRAYRAGLQDLLDKARVALLTNQPSVAAGYVQHGLGLVAAYSKSGALDAGELGRWLADFQSLLPAVQGTGPAPQAPIGTPGGTGKVAAATGDGGGNGGGGGVGTALGWGAGIAAVLALIAAAA